MAYEDIDTKSREALRRASAHYGDNEPVRTRVRVTPFGKLVAVGSVALLGVTGFNILSDGNGRDDMEAGRSNVDAEQTDGAEPTLEQLEQRAAEMLTEEDFSPGTYDKLQADIEELRSSESTE